MANQIIEAEPVEPMALAEVEQDPTFNNRAKRSFKEGYKDGYAGLYSPINIIPPKFRAHYNAGYALGVYDYTYAGRKPEEVSEVA